MMTPPSIVSRRFVRFAVSTAALLAAVPSSAHAQDAALSAIKSNWKEVIANITAAAEEMTEANYAFKPTPTVRSFGELIGHIAGTQDLICAAVLGEPQPAEDAIEKSAKTKAALVAALKASTAHCDKAYAVAPAKLADAIEMFGSKNTKVGALVLNAVHDGEHYGNIVTYLRLKGLVPPSSKR
jgi:uncharacterized damage-inducible protein DinB